MSAIPQNAFPVSSVYHSPCFPPPDHYVFGETFLSLMVLSKYKFEKGSIENLYQHVQKIFPQWEQSSMVDLIHAAGNQERIVAILRTKCPIFDQNQIIENVQTEFNKLKEGFEDYVDVPDPKFSLTGRAELISDII